MFREEYQAVCGAAKKKGEFLEKNPLGYVAAAFLAGMFVGLGCVLMVLCVYFSFENQRENYDAETMCFNRNAFHRQMAEYYANRKPLSIVNVTLENYERINTMYGHEYGRKAMLCAKEMIDGVLGGSVFHSRSNTFTVFYSDCEVDCRKLESLRHALCSHCFPDAQLEFRISVIKKHLFISMFYANRNFNSPNKTILITIWNTFHHFTG